MYPAKYSRHVVKQTATKTTSVVKSKNCFCILGCTFQASCQSLRYLIDGNHFPTSRQPACFCNYRSQQPTYSKTKPSSVTSAE